MEDFGGASGGPRQCLGKLWEVGLGAGLGRASGKPREVLEGFKVYELEERRRGGEEKRRRGGEDEDSDAALMK